MDIERLRALEKDIRESVALADAEALGVMGVNRPARWADELASLIAELGQEVGAVEPVAFAVELPDGSIGKLGWMDYASFDLCTGVSELLEGCRYVYAYRTSPAHTSEARDAARYRFIRECDADDDDSLHVGGNAYGAELKTGEALDAAVDAAMRQEGE